MTAPLCLRISFLASSLNCCLLSNGPILKWPKIPKFTTSLLVDFNKI